MGCWNHTCVLTNLPIHVGDDVVVFLLRETPDGRSDSHCYSTNYWEPMGLYFEGKYNDYGAVEECKGPFLSLIVETVKHRLIEMELGKNEYHDIAVKKETFNIQQLFEADHEGRLFVQPSSHARHCYQTTKTRLKHVVIRRSALDALLSTYTCKGYEPNEAGEYLPAIFSYETIKERIKVELEYYRSKTDIMRILHSDNTGTRIVNEFIRKNNGMFSSEVVHVLLSSDTTSVAYAEIVNQIAVGDILSAVMENSRHMWCPPSGVGSQDSSTNTQTFLANLTIAEANRINSRFNED